MLFFEANQLCAHSDGTLVDGKDGSEETHTSTCNDGSSISVVLPSLVH